MTLQTTRARANVLGVGVDALDMPTAVSRLLDAAARRAGGYVCVTGVHGVMEAQRDAEFRRILNASTMTTPDGVPTVWVGRSQGHRGMQRVYGPDLMLGVCEDSVARGYTHYLFGGGPGTAERLKASLEARFPGIRVVGTCTPPFRPLTPTEEDRLVDEVRALAPHFVWVGLSTPKQERFMDRMWSRLGGAVLLGVGAAFDMNSGQLAQAPRWMQRAGLEWLYRLYREPRRLWRRYLRNNPAFVLALALESLGLRRSQELVPSPRV